MPGACLAAGDREAVSIPNTIKKSEFIAEEQDGTFLRGNIKGKRDSG